jgi:hypothetical protein
MPSLCSIAREALRTLLSRTFEKPTPGNLGAIEPVPEAPREALEDIAGRAIGAQGQDPVAFNEALLNPSVKSNQRLLKARYKSLLLAIPA